jgi:hypothetical protein
MIFQTFDWLHYIEVLLGAATVFVPLWWANRQQTKNNHAQNLKHFNYLINETTERPHHKHLDGQPGDEGPLMAQNIVYPPRPFNGNNR